MLIPLQSSQGEKGGQAVKKQLLPALLMVPPTKSDYVEGARAD